VSNLLIFIIGVILGFFLAPLVWVEFSQLVGTLTTKLRVFHFIIVNRMSWYRRCKEKHIPITIWHAMFGNIHEASDDKLVRRDHQV
jgi:hypothetical protein